MARLRYRGIFLCEKNLELIYKKLERRTEVEKGFCTKSFEAHNKHINKYISNCPFNKFILINANKFLGTS